LHFDHMVMHAAASSSGLSMHASLTGNSSAATCSTDATCAPEGRGADGVDAMA
jgi:hypothetical protein